LGIFDKERKERKESEGSLMPVEVGVPALRPLLSFPSSAVRFPISRFPAFFRSFPAFPLPRLSPSASRSVL
jgi:hypothetical protein